MIRPVLDLKGHARPEARPAVAMSPTSSRLARFRAVYDANYHRVLGYALRRTPAREDAEDIVAETFLTAWRHLGEVPEGEAARLWLYGVARNALANQRRGERRRGRLRVRLEAEPRPNPWHRPDADARLASVGTAFARLRQGDREVLALVAWEGLDPGEIATVLGCSRNAARIRLHRARRKLAHELRRLEVYPARSSWIPAETEHGLRRELR